MLTVRVMTVPRSRASNEWPMAFMQANLTEKAPSPDTEMMHKFVGVLLLIIGLTFSGVKCPSHTHGVASHLDASCPVAST